MFRRRFDEGLRSDFRTWVRKSDDNAYVRLAREAEDSGPPVQPGVTAGSLAAGATGAGGGDLCGHQSATQAV